jgi:WhiB family transcriptional regulator, redox-sensing transcriptional regulator
MDDDNWTRRAACRGEDPDIFFNLSGNFELVVRRLRKLCYGCPVLDDCRAYIDWVEDDLPQTLCHGFWAGETVKERVRRRKIARKNDTTGQLQEAG